MKNKHMLVFIFLICFSIFHLIRDALQMLYIENVITTFFKTQTNWCGWYCNLISIPFAIYILTGSIITIQRNKIGVLAYSVGLIFFCWVLMFLYDVLIFN